MAHIQNIPVELESRKDKYQQVFFMARFRAPMTLKFKNGVCFLIYTSEPDNEEMRIAMPKPGSEFVSVKKRLKENGDVDKYIIPLEPRKDDNGDTFYIGLAHDENLELDMSDTGYVFFVFTAKSGQEELHIGRNDYLQQDKRDSSQETPETSARRPDFKTESGNYPATVVVPRRAAFG